MIGEECRIEVEMRTQCIDRSTCKIFNQKDMCGTFVIINIRQEFRQIIELENRLFVKPSLTGNVENGDLPSS